MSKILTHKVARIASVAVGVAMLVGIATPALAQSTTDSLLAQIAALQAQLLALQGSSSTSASCNFTMNLSMGMTNSQVMSLQKFLNAHGAMVASSGAGSPGMESSYFGAKTKAAVMAWQNMNASQVLTPAGLTAGTGYWGAMSRAYANTMCGTGSTTTGGGTTPPVVTGGSAMVSAGTQPAASLAPQNASRVPFTRFTITTGASAVTLNSVEVDRTGLAQDAVFSGIVLLDQNGIQLGVAKTLNSLHHVTVGAPVVIPANSSMTFTVAGNMAASLANYAGQVATLSVTGVNTNGTVSGSFPITGAGQTINASLTLGTSQLYVSAFDPNGAVTKNVGDSGIKFAGVRLTAGSAEQVRLWSIRWNQSGSVGSGDLSNVMVYVGSTAYPVTVSSDGKYYTATFGSGIVIDKGNSQDIYLQGDITGSSAANRTIEFDLYKNTDVYLTGETYGYGIVPTPGSAASASTNGSEFITSDGTTSGTAGTPFYSGSVLTVNAGTATTISKAPEVASQNIAVNVPGQVLGGYSTSFTGEPVTVQSSIFTIATSSTALWNNAGPITNITIYDETGKQVAGPVDEATTCTTGCSITFTDGITYPVGRHVFTIKGKIPSGVQSSATVIVSATPSSGWTNVTGQVTGNSISLSGNGAFSMNTMTVRAAALAVAVQATPAAQNIVAGAQGYTFANYQLDASQSGEDVRVSSLTPQVIYANTPLLPEISSCQLWDGATALTTGSNVYNPSGTATTSSTMTRTFTFDNSIIVTKGSVKTLALKCNLSGSALSGSKYQWGIAAVGTTNVSATGVTSSATITATGPANNGQIMTVSSTGALVAALDPSAPGYTIVYGGATGVTVNQIQLHASNEDVTLQRVGLRLTGAVTGNNPVTVASTTPADLTQVYLYDGATLIGTATFTGNSITATSTLNTPITIARDSDKVITVKADFADVNASSAAIEGHLVKIDVDANGTNTQGYGAQSGATVNVTGSTSVSGQRLFGSYPVLAADTSSAGGWTSNGVSDGVLMHFKVTASNGGSLGLYQFNFQIATTSATVSAVNLFCYTDSAYSQPCTGVQTDGRLMVSNQTPSGNNPQTTLITAQDTNSNAVVLSVPQGGTRFFALKSTVAGTGTTYSVSSTLLGDAAYPSLGTTSPGGATSPYQGAFVTTAGTISAKNFVWSPFGTTTSPTTSGLDWTDGFGVSGLPASGITMSRTN